MNIRENIVYLASVNSRSCFPQREESIKKNIPYFEIYKDSLNRLSVRGGGHHGHDNEPRMDMWEQYLKLYILPNIGDEYDVTGFYNIELHDSYTYLKNDKDYKNVMTFAKFKDDSKPVLIPDPYMICNWGNMLTSVHDESQIENKLSKVVFTGTTTGNRDPSKNERIKTCLWSLDHQDFCEFKITKVAQMSVESVVKTYGSQWKDIYLPRHVSIHDQLRYRYHLNIDGNTCRFDVWPYKTNSLVLKTQSQEMLWYHPLFRANSEYVEVDTLERLREISEFYNRNLNIAKHITRNANALASELFVPMSHMLYTVSLFETMAINK